MIRFLFSVYLILFCTTVALAQPPKPIRLYLSPASLPSPPLRYQLLPDSRQITPGDAAAIYKQDVELLAKKPRIQEYTLKDSVRELPLNQFPKEELRKELEVYSDVFELL